MERAALDRLEAQLRRQKRRRRRLLAGLLLLLVMGAAGFAAWRLRPPPKSQFELDADALAGFLPTHTQEEIQAELNRIIDESRFNISINPTPTVQADGTANFMIENVPANHYWMQVTVYYQDSAGQEQELYRSGMIRQGYYIQEAKATGGLPPAGEYNGRAVFAAVQPESGEEIGRSAATLRIQVLD